MVYLANDRVAWEIKDAFISHAYEHEYYRAPEGWKVVVTTAEIPGEFDELTGAIRIG